MKFKISINKDFRDTDELANVIEKLNLPEQIRNGNTAKGIFDADNKRIGQWELIEGQNDYDSFHS